MIKRLCVILYFTTLVGGFQNYMDYLTRNSKNGFRERVSHLEKGNNPIGKTLVNRKRTEFSNNSYNFKNETRPVKDSPYNKPPESKILLIDTSLFRNNKDNEEDEEDDEQFTIERDIKYNFTNIGGYDNIKNELLQMKDILDNIKHYKKYNIRTPKGLLLEGPPGNGKTLLSKCFAGECGFNFISVSGSEFNEKYIGVGAARIRNLFKKAKKNQPCILFIDELDALGAKRSSNGDEGGSERFQTLNQLLVLMDGFNSDSMNRIFIMGATNRKDILDKALLRSGRFDKIVHVPNPDEKTRKAIVEIHREKKPICKNIDNNSIVELTNGLSGADIENILNEVSLLALRNNKTVDSIKMFEDIRDRIIIGTSVNERNLSKNVKRRIAIHECGHLLIGLMCNLHEKPTRVTIESSGKDSLGYTFFSRNENETGLYSKQYLREKIMTLLGGRAAEEICFDDEISTGAIDDLYRVVNLAKQMVVEHGMVNRPIFSFLSENKKEMIDKQIQKLIEECYQETKDLLTKNKNLLYWYSKQLQKRNTLNEKQILSTLRVGLMLYPSTDFKNQ